MSRKRRWSLGLACVLVVSAISATATANAPRPFDYRTETSGDSVVVCPQNFGERGCQAGDTLLRHNADSGETTVVSGDMCSSDQICETGRREDAGVRNCCFVDECVPAGTYQYGLKSPYSCDKNNTAYYFVEVTVQNDPEGCTPSNETYEEALPWDPEERQACQYPADGIPSTVDTADTSEGPEGDAATESDATSGSTPPGDSSGCSTAGTDDRSLDFALILLFNVLVFGAGWSSMRRRQDASE